LTIQECYTALEGNYAEVLGRLYSEALIQKFVIKFLKDQSYQLLENTLKTGDYKEAFRAAHTLKGVTQNLSFTKLYRSSHDITEALRSGDHDLVSQLLPQLESDYLQTIAAIRAYQAAQ